MPDHDQVAIIIIIRTVQGLFIVAGDDDHPVCSSQHWRPKGIEELYTVVRVALFLLRAAEPVGSVDLVVRPRRNGPGENKDAGMDARISRT